EFRRVLFRSARRLSYQLPAVRESLSYHFEGGDNRSRSFAVRVHDRPSIALVALTIEPPAYTKEPARTIEGVRGEIRAPIGSVLRFRATSDQVIRGARYRLDDGEPVAIAAGDDPNSIEWHVELARSSFLELHVTGDYDFLSEPWRLGLVAIPDAPPEVRLIIEGPSRRVTTDGVVRYRVEARDDWGVAALRLEIERPGQSTAQGDAGGGASRTRTVDLLPFDPFAADELGAFRSGGRTERTLSVSELEVAAGDRFILRAVATDNDAREGG